jgi:hypothetical protein
MARSFRCAPTAHYTHILPAMVFATQSPYSGWQTGHIQPERYAQFFLNFFCKNAIKILTGFYLI